LYTGSIDPFESYKEVGGFQVGVKKNYSTFSLNRNYTNFNYRWYGDDFTNNFGYISSSYQTSLNGPLQENIHMKFYSRGSTEICSNVSINGNLMLNSVDFTNIPSRVSSIEVDVTTLKNKTVNINVVNGNTSIGSLSINADGSIKCNGSLSSTGSIDISGSLSCSNLTMGGDLSVFGDIDVFGKVDILGNLDARNNINCSKSISVLENLQVTKNLNVIQNIDCNDINCNNINALSDIFVVGNLHVNGTTFLHDLRVSGTARINNLDDNDDYGNTLNLVPLMGQLGPYVNSYNN